MAIRKDIDDMLNSLRTGSAPQKQEPQKPAPKPAQPRKSVYDSMSVDDLLSALTDDKKKAQPSTAETKAPAKPEPKETVLPEKNAAPKKSAVDAELQRKLKEALDPEPKPVAEKKAESVKVKNEPKPIAEKTEPKPVEEKPVPKPAEEPKAEDKPNEEPVPPKKKKRIVITGELPDYEALRREELEKNRIASEKAAAAAKSAAAKANELTPVKAIAAEAAAKAEESAAAEAEQPVEEAAAEETVTEEAVTEAAVEAVEAEDEPVPEDGKKKGGFFSKRKNKHRKETAPEQPVAEEEVSAEAPQPTAEEENVPAMAEAADFEIESIDEEQTEAAAETAEPSVDELLDAALAEINSIQNADALFEAAQAEKAAEEEKEAEEAASSSDAEDTDTVSEPVDDMQEDAVEIEKSADESPDETEVRSEEKQPDAEPEEAPQPKKKMVLRRILDEKPEDILNERSEKPEADEDDAPSARKGGAKKRLYTVFGAVCAVFAVIGFVFVIVSGVKLAKSFTSGEVKKDGFTEVVYPAVIMDIDEFDSPSELTSNQIITASIWSIIMSEERASKYSVTPGTDTISIPYMDVEARAVEMFGTNHPEFKHCTVGPLDSRFIYSDGAYNVKLSTITFTYAPEIKSIVKSGSDYKLTVDYVDELPQWMDKSVAKSVEFSLTEKENGTYTINSMKILYVKSSNI